jgi:hypothetical protein
MNPLGKVNSDPVPSRAAFHAAKNPKNKADGKPSAQAKTTAGIPEEFGTLISLFVLRAGRTLKGRDCRCSSLIGRLEFRFEAGPSRSYQNAEIHALH